ncbi:MAG: hypothetical protein Fur0037_03330 [Planctomycetota bacterium]
MSRIAKALCAASLAFSALSAQSDPLRPCTGMIPVPVATASATIGSQTCSAGFSGLINPGFPVKVQNTLCPLMMVVTPAHSDPRPHPGSDTDVQVNGQVPNVVVMFRCVGHYFLFVWVYDTCDVTSTRIAGAVDNYGLVRCAPVSPQSD